VVKEPVFDCPSPSGTELYLWLSSPSSFFPVLPSETGFPGFYCRLWPARFSNPEEREEGYCNFPLGIPYGLDKAERSIGLATFPFLWDSSRWPVAFPFPGFASSETVIRASRASGKSRPQPIFDPVAFLSIRWYQGLVGIFRNMETFNYDLPLRRRQRRLPSPLAPLWRPLPPALRLNPFSFLLHSDEPACRRALSPPFFCRIFFFHWGA